MPNYNGVWSLSTHYQAVGSQNWAGFITGGDVGVFIGGTGSHATTRGYVHISSLGDETNFGTLSTAISNCSGSGSSTRGIIASRTPDTNSISFITVNTKGDLVDFGDRTVAAASPASLSNDTRAVFCGDVTSSNVIDFVTIASTGNATDFGNATVVIVGQSSGCGSTTRGLILGGETSPSDTNVIQYITIASAGNASDFGDLTEAKQMIQSVSNSIRAVRGGGVGDTNVMDYVTVASTGNATDFGDLSIGRRQFMLGNCANGTRGIFAGGDGPSGDVAIIEYITIASAGNAQDFGDLTAISQSGAALSDCHGGLA